MCAFLGLVGHYRRFIKGFAHIAQPLNDHLTSEGASRKSDHVLLSEDALKAFEVFKQAFITVLVLAFTDYTKPFLMETDVSKDGLRVALSQKQADGCYHPVAYSSRALMPHEKNYHLTKLEFLALNWAVTGHFKEYLPYQPFLVNTDNNPLTYIIMTPNLDATGHQWVGALVQFNFKLEYQKGCDRAEVHNPAMAKGDLSLEKEVHVTTGCTLVQIHVTDWAIAQREDPMLSAVLDWLKAQKKTDLKALLAEHASSKEGQLILWNKQNFMIHQGALYLCSTPKGKTENLLLLVVPKAH